MVKPLQPDGWAKPVGYANGTSARGRVIHVAGQIGWNKDSKFETDDFVGQVKDELELVSEACKPFDLDAFREGHLTPVYFGSALRNFGVGDLLEGLGQFAPPPRAPPPPPPGKPPPPPGKPPRPCWKPGNAVLPAFVAAR